LNDSITNDTVHTFDWLLSDGQTSNEENPVFNLPRAGGTYTAQLVAGLADRACTDTILINFIVPDNTLDTLVEVASCNNPYIFKENSYTQSGIYIDTLLSAIGCDTIVTLNLTILPLETKTIDTVICYLNNYDFYGRTIIEAGVYYDTVPALSGCDTVVTLNLTVLPLETKTIDTVICYLNSYDFYGRTIMETGVYSDTVPALSGCDTIVTLNLTVLPLETKTIDTTICNPNSYDFYGRTIMETGIYYDTVPAFSGCDTVVTLNLTVLPLETKTINVAICYLDSYDFYGKTIMETGIYYDTVPAFSGCDTVVTLNLTVLPLETKTINAVICYLNSYDFYGKTIMETGIYYDTVPAFSGCDTVVTVN
jgi:hypothetical protein